jgi:hypothetical protein
MKRVVTSAYSPIATSARRAGRRLWRWLCRRSSASEVMVRAMEDEQIRHRFTVLTWAVGILAALTAATLGMAVALSYQLGQIAGELTVLVGHVQMR